MLTLPRLVFLFSATCSLLVGEVTRSPFLPPGYESRPKPADVTPPVTVATPPVRNVAITNEIEFRGYFSLGTGDKRKLCFSLFNKKLNRGEWVSLGEKTAEDFEVTAFDMDSETLSVSYGGSTAQMSLYVSKGGSSSPSQSGGAPKALTSSAAHSATGASAAGKPRVMPPRPKNTPTLPPWLAARASSGLTSSGSTPSSRLRNVTSAGRSFPVPAPLAPRFPSTSSPGLATPSAGTGGASPSPGHVLAPVTLAPSSPATAAPSASLPSSGSTSTAAPEGSAGNAASSDALDLNNLPPPPPPPDILPPGPPPNIQPSRE